MKIAKLLGQILEKMPPDAEVPAGALAMFKVAITMLGADEAPQKKKLRKTYTRQIPVEIATARKKATQAKNRAANIELNKEGKPYTRSPEARANITAALKETWAKKRLKAQQEARAQ